MPHECALRLVVIQPKLSCVLSHAFEGGFLLGGWVPWLRRGVKVITITGLRDIVGAPLNVLCVYEKAARFSDRLLLRHPLQQRDDGAEVGGAFLETLRLLIVLLRR